jgi:hypothetical protein
LSTKLRPVGNPVVGATGAIEIDGVGLPVVVTVKVPAELTVNEVELGEVIEGAWPRACPAA